MTLENWQRGGFGLYVHWPFCEAKCPYCDFNSHVVETVDHQAWASAFEAEIDRVGQRTPDRVLTSVFFGGGTPSLMAPDTVHRILERANSVWNFGNDIEITLEANPSSVEAQRFDAYRRAGVNRISIGVQSLVPADLKALGRLHSVDDALKAMEIARHTFDRFSLDLIYARQGQTREDWWQELQRCLSFGPSHLSLYQLTIEDGTAFGTLHKAGKLRGLPNEDLAADLFEMTQEMTEAHGLMAYEVSNHAKPGHEARHNMIYWNGGDWAGIGPGAHGRLTIGQSRYSSVAPLQPKAWLETAKRQADGATRFEDISGRDAALEYLMMSLRTQSGCDLDHLSALDPGFSETVLSRAEDPDLMLERSENRLCLGPKGRILLNAVLAQLVRDSA